MTATSNGNDGNSNGGGRRSRPKKTKPAGSDDDKHPKSGAPPGSKKRQQQQQATSVNDSRKSTKGGGGGKPHSGGRGGSTTFQSSGTVPVNAKQKRENRKQGRRAKQLEAMDKKAKAEDDYFRECCKEAAQQQQPNAQNNKQQLKSREIELFGKQGARGINFAKYGDIKVEVKPGAVAQKGQKKNNNLKNNKGANKEVESMVFNEFDDLKLPPTIASNIKLMNYDKSTPIHLAHC